VIVAVVGLLVLASFIRSRRIRSNTPPWFVPRFLHKRWTKWAPSKYSHLNRSDHQHLETVRSSSEVPSSTTRLPEGELDRRQSVRSILTLPAYTPAVQPSEQLIAREGERAGIDVVVEFPENESEVESRRDEEMETLFQIRQARRREEADRETRRERRRQARDAGNWQLLEQLEQESRNRARRRAADEQRLESAIDQAEQTSDPHLALPTSRQMIQELHALRQSNQRDRRVSSVSYAELGLARHDGSRLRADSVDSRDDRPLLDSAASMGGEQRSRAVSRAGSEQASRDVSRDVSREPTSRPVGRGGAHARHASEGQSSLRSDSDASPDHARRPSQPRLLTPQSGGSGNGSGELPPFPPSYEDDLSVHGGEAPPYESPVQPHELPAGSAATSSASPPIPTPNTSSSSSNPAPDEDDQLSASAHTASSYLAYTPPADDEDDEYPGGPVRTHIGDAGPSDDSSSAAKGKAKAPESPAKKLPALSRLHTHNTPPEVEVTSATPVGVSGVQHWEGERSGTR
jgi:hypothetical protein